MKYKIDYTDSVHFEIINVAEDQELTVYNGVVLVEGDTIQTGIPLHRVKRIELIEDE